jgi:hypothetical protein
MLARGQAMLARGQAMLARDQAMLARKDAFSIHFFKNFIFGLILR